MPSKRRKIAEFYITAGEEDEFASEYVISLSTATASSPLVSANNTGLASFVRDFKPAVGAAWIADSVSKHALQNPFTYLFVTQDLKDETQPQPGAIVPVGPNLSQQGGNVGTDVPEREVRHVGSIKLGYSRESEELWLQEQLDLAREGSPGRNQSQTQSQGQSQRSERNRFGRLASRQQGSSQATDRERDMTRARARKRPNWDLEEDSADRANRLAVLAEERQAAAPAGDGETVNDGPREETEPEVDHGPTVERDANVGDAEQAEPRRSPRKRSGKGKERASPLINPEERPEPPRSIMKKRRQGAVGKCKTAPEMLLSCDLALILILHPSLSTLQLHEPIHLTTFRSLMSPTLAPMYVLSCPMLEVIV